MHSNQWYWGTHIETFLPMNLPMSQLIDWFKILTILTMWKVIFAVTLKHSQWKFHIGFRDDLQILESYYNNEFLRSVTEKTFTFSAIKCFKLIREKEQYFALMQVCPNCGLHEARFVLKWGPPNNLNSTIEISITNKKNNKKLLSYLCFLVENINEFNMMLQGQDN